jgi:DNA-binding CsgD family transcriptional regulator
MYLSDPDAASLTATPGQLEYVLRNKHRYEKKAFRERRWIKEQAQALLNQGKTQKEAAEILDASIHYIKTITSAPKPYKRRDIVIARALGKTIAQIAAEFNISIGSVQNYLKPPKKLYKRTNIINGAITYYDSMTTLLQAHNGLTKTIIHNGTQFWEYEFSIVTDTSTVDLTLLE